LNESCKQKDYKEDGSGDSPNELGVLHRVIISPAAAVCETSPGAVVRSLQSNQLYLRIGAGYINALYMYLYAHLLLF